VLTKNNLKECLTSGKKGDMLCTAYQLRVAPKPESYRRVGNWYTKSPDLNLTMLGFVTKHRRKKARTWRA